MAELTELQKQLFELQDIKYRDFHSKLMPETAKEKIIELIPVLLNFAKYSPVLRNQRTFCSSFLTSFMRKITFI